MKIFEKIWDFIMITFGTFVVAASVYFLMIPSGASVGSVSGLSMILANFLPFSIATISFVINAILLIVGFVLVGKEFGIKTVYTTLLLPVMLGLFEILIPNIESFTGDQVVDIVAYCVLVAVGQSILFTRNASSGGLDIVAKLMNKYLHMDLGQALGIVGMTVALSSAFVSDKKTLVLAILSTYFNGLVIDHFIFGSTIKRRVCIISKKEKEILDFILYELHSGATKYHAYGTYSDKVHTEINTIVDKNEYQKLMSFITETDPDAFVTVYSVNEMRYKPKQWE